MIIISNKVRVSSGFKNYPSHKYCYRTRCNNKSSRCSNIDFKTIGIKTFALRWHTVNAKKIKVLKYYTFLISSAICGNDYPIYNDFIIYILFNIVPNTFLIINFSKSMFNDFLF